MGRFLIAVMIISAILFVVITNTTTPFSSGATGILGLFIVTYLLVLSALTFFVYGVSLIIIRASRSFTVRKPLQPISIKKAYYYSSVIALAPVILVGMLSVGTLGVYEFCLVVFWVVVGCVYVTKRTT